MIDKETGAELEKLKNQGLNAGRPVDLFNCKEKKALLALNRERLENPVYKQLKVGRVIHIQFDEVLMN